MSWSPAALSLKLRGARSEQSEQRMQVRSTYQRPATLSSQRCVWSAMSRRSDLSTGKSPRAAGFTRGSAPERGVAGGGAAARRGASATRRPNGARPGTRSSRRGRLGAARPRRGLGRQHDLDDAPADASGPLVPRVGEEDVESVLLPLLPRARHADEVAPRPGLRRRRGALHIGVGEVALDVLGVVLRERRGRTVEADAPPAQDVADLEAE